MTASNLISALLGWAVMLYIVRRAAPSIREDVRRLRGRLSGRSRHGARLDPQRADRAQRGSTADETTPDEPPDDDGIGYFVMTAAGEIVFPLDPRHNATGAECAAFCMRHHEDEDPQMWNLEIYESNERGGFRPATITRALDDPAWGPA